MATTKIACPVGHTNTWKKGKVPTRTGLKQRYVCFTCGRTFFKTEPKPATKTIKAKRKGKK